MGDNCVLSIDVGMKNLAVCLLNGPVQIELWEVFNIGDTRDMTRFLSNTVKILDENPEIYNTKRIKTVLIEKQPSFNPKMRAIASALHMYFVIKGFKNIKQYSAKYKLQMCKSDKVYTDSTKYAKNKKRSVDTTVYYLEKEPSLRVWREKFRAAKKKDDFADSFLQGVSFYKIYCAASRTMKKPTHLSIKNGNLDDNHFNWFYNTWIQEHETCLLNNIKSTLGPMDTYTIKYDQELDKTSYTLENYIDDQLTKYPSVKNKLTELYGDTAHFINTKIQVHAHDEDSDAEVDAEVDVEVDAEAATQGVVG